jgi:glycosyltransferase involved in cell wall biosynthesis
MELKLNTPNSRPLVSICIPTYNGEKWLRECLNSALAQTYDRLEILILDDVSTDATVSIARSFQDERISLAVNQQNRGLVGNWNESIRQAKGDLIKFLFQDDTLYPECVEQMVGMFEAHPELGLVFARRDIVVEADAPAKLAQRLLSNYSELHLKFAALRKVTAGRELFAEHFVKGLYLSCVAEPPSTLIRKTVFQELGLFNTKLHQICDIEMWLRIVFFYDIGFVDEKLLSYRFHGQAATASNHATGKNKYDRFWLLEGLCSHPEIKEAYPEILQWRDDLFAHYTQSFVRPKAGWRSIGSRTGLLNAGRDFLEVPSRFGLLKEVNAFRATGQPIHPRL